MKTTIALLLFAAAFVRGADPQKAAELWQQSLADESNQDYAAALKKTLEFKSAGGETYLAAVRGGWLSYLAKDFEKAVQFYVTAAKQEPRAVTPHLGLVYTALEMQKPKEALAAARNGLNIDQYHFKLLMIAGELLFNQGDHRKAETYFDRAHHLHPEDPTAMSWLGWARIAQGQVRLAAPLFERLMQINPDGYLVRDGFAISHGPPPR
ncbi:MAG: tetratricopeptide repeat protein [Prosthecobacter sp.]|jgi:tetratricopeptide (TPR) repeat protein|uniref:tetratricopeptide repeat protein n=1 Tax=Prosthecobacter sp. TaxID=1965333 RepID=UPI0019F40D2E|nr:tetratricopeptide repeat protein [Prosthecobacter sp.]MBE2287850.1 tetratricopeptide repeat protein [Prosthecobacter sp.]